MNYNEFAKKAHDCAERHGFWKIRVSNEHCLMLVCTEIAELVEADRKMKRANLAMFDKEVQTPQEPGHVEEHWRFCFNNFIKDSLEDEFADAVIRLFDLAGELKIDFDKMLPCRYHRAFDRFTLTENAFGLIKGLSKGQIAIEKRVQFGLEYLSRWAASEKVNLERHVRLKMRYNESRPELHGKKY